MRTLPVGTYAPAYNHTSLGIKKASIRVMRGRGRVGSLQLQRNALKESSDVLYCTLYGILLLVIYNKAGRWRLQKPPATGACMYGHGGNTQVYILCQWQ
jgi:hypothetical protein